MSKIEDEKFMSIALELAKKGRGFVSPNPLVGAVFVKKGKVIAKGYHKKVGSHHAEVEALKKLSLNDVKNGTLYVNLEPCCHSEKRTNPCINYLFSKNVKDVVISHNDPNKQVNGKGVNSLRKAGVKVKTGCLESEAKKLNEIFIKSNTTSLPFLSLKIAMSLDGNTAYKSDNKRWLTGIESRKYVHKLRSEYDAILTTSSTVLSDDPHLGVRHIKGRDPKRIIIDRNLKTSLRSKVYRNKNVIIVTCVSKNNRKLKQLIEAGYDVILLKTNFNLSTLLKALFKRDICSILVECGPTFAESLIKSGQVDKFFIFYAPIILGGKGKGLLKGVTDIKFDRVRKIKNDILIEAYPKK
ncbi:bifunctional diaminohydroxyphosphoribosylaminopyrimidine deaminase/5-amino-6-(5-phosphoribosylamino)uracil reductase RibD [Pseudomonadota bacterium]